MFNSTCQLLQKNDTDSEKLWLTAFARNASPRSFDCSHQHQHRRLWPPLQRLRPLLPRLRPLLQRPHLVQRLPWQRRRRRRRWPGPSRRRWRGRPRQKRQRQKHQLQKHHLQRQQLSPKLRSGNYPRGQCRCWMPCWMTTRESVSDWWWRKRKADADISAAS